MMPRACLVSTALALLLAGCGGATYKTAPVSGRVTLNGEPLAEATVMFIPEVPAGAKEELPSSGGVTDGQGRYSLQLNSGSKGKGAVVGKHKVVVIMGANVGAHDTAPTFHKQLPARYNRNTELTCDVPAAGREDADFPLKSP